MYTGSSYGQLVMHLTLSNNIYNIYIYKYIYSYIYIHTWHDFLIINKPLKENPKYLSISDDVGYGQRIAYLAIYSLPFIHYCLAHYFLRYRILCAYDQYRDIGYIHIILLIPKIMSHTHKQNEGGDILRDGHANLRSCLVLLSMKCTLSPKTFKPIILNLKVREPHLIDFCTLYTLVAIVYSSCCYLCAWLFNYKLHIITYRHITTVNFKIQWKVVPIVQILEVMTSFV